MREIIGLTIGLYLTVALVVGGAGAYAFMSHTTKPAYKCEPGPDWVPWVAIRGVAWPYRFWVEQKEAKSIPDWLMVQYDAFPTACRATKPA